MALWEYKVITSGKGGFATPALLEKFLNDLGKEDWEIIEFRAQPDNPLAFSGLARRPTQRDWTLEDAAAAAARTEAEKLRAEFEAKFKAATGATAAGTAGAGAEEGDKPSHDDTFRRPRDTERDLDPTAPEEEEVFEVPEEEELPTFFDAIRPHMRRNQRGPGLSVSIEYLVKKFDMLEADLIGAVKECGLTIPAAENEPPAYVEYDGDLYWVNINRQKQLFINTREKPRPVFRVVQAARVGAEPAEEIAGRSQEPGDVPAAGPVETPEMKSEPAAAPAPLPQGIELLDKLRPMMRRSRGGWSGSLGFLSRALKCREDDLNAALAPLGLQLAGGGEKPPQIELGGFVYWLNKDGRGQTWINAREQTEEREPDGGSEGRPPPPAGESSPDRQPELPLAAASPAAGAADAPESATLAAVRLLLKETKTGAIAGKIDRLAEELGKTPEEFLAALTAAGLKVPEKPREKPVFVGHAAEIFWLNKNAKDELWLNAKASKFADKPEAGGDGGKKSGRGRTRKRETG